MGGGGGGDKCGAYTMGGGGGAHLLSHLFDDLAHLDHLLCHVCVGSDAPLVCLRPPQRVAIAGRIRCQRAVTKWREGTGGRGILPRQLGYGTRAYWRGCRRRRRRLAAAAAGCRACSFYKARRGLYHWTGRRAWLHGHLASLRTAIMHGSGQRRRRRRPAPSETVLHGRRSRRPAWHRLSCWAGRGARLLHKRLGGGGGRLRRGGHWLILHPQPLASALCSLSGRSVQRTRPPSAAAQRSCA